MPCGLDAPDCLIGLPPGPTRVYSPESSSSPCRGASPEPDAAVDWVEVDGMEAGFPTFVRKTAPGMVEMVPSLVFPILPGAERGFRGEEMAKLAN